MLQTLYALYDKRTFEGNLTIASERRGGHSEMQMRPDECNWETRLFSRVMFALAVALVIFGLVVLMLRQHAKEYIDGD